MLWLRAALVGSHAAAAVWSPFTAQQQQVRLAQLFLSSDANFRSEGSPSFCFAQADPHARLPPAGPLCVLGDRAGLHAPALPLPAAAGHRPQPPGVCRWEAAPRATGTALCPPRPGRHPGAPFIHDSSGFAFFFPPPGPAQHPVVTCLDWAEKGWGPCATALRPCFWTAQTILQMGDSDWPGLCWLWPAVLWPGPGRCCMAATQAACVLPSCPAVSCPGSPIAPPAALP